MNGEKQSEYFLYKKWKSITNKKIFVLSSLSILRYITEIVSTFFFLFKYKNITYIWIDPLNSLTWALLKKFWKTNINIFYTPDYSPQRFKNNTLNKIYHWIDRTCINNADKIWNVSSRIQDIRVKMWVKDKSIFIPNIPGIINKEILNTMKDKFTLVTLWIIDKQLDHINIFKAIQKLKNDFPLIKYKIIWNWPKEEEYKQIAKNMWLEKNILFLWFLQHEEALKEIASSWIWLALYNWKWWFNKYGDSMKCREFFALWLPVLTTDTHSTVEDIKKFNNWIVVDINSEDYIIAIKNIFRNFDSYSQNSYNLWKRYSDFYSHEINTLW
jgi:glycosyltransferase involved in cell wall biosynthesis